MSLQHLQQQFCAGLSPFRQAHQLQQAEALIHTHGTLSKRDRLGIYQHNISGAHIKVLQQVFPVCEQILGEAPFATLAREYCWKNPEASSDMNLYGQFFAEFLKQRSEDIPALAELPYLHDLALLEYAWQRAHYRPNDATFDFQAFAEVQQQPQQLQFHLSHSLYLLNSEWPLLELWQQHRDGQPP